MISLSQLTDRAVLAVEGEESHAFLQGLISNDIRKVGPERAIFAALLSPQGKYLFEFFILEHHGALLLETNRERLPALLQRLTMYRLRAKVTFAERSDLIVVAAWGEGSLATAANAIAYDDPRLPALGKRILFQKDNAPESNDDYETHRLQLGIPEGNKDLIVDRSLLLEFGYDHLNAVDFNKGCYVGQEVTARSKHRASLHKYVHQVASSSPLPPSGTKIVCDGREIGELRSSRGTIGLALLRIEDAALSPRLMAEDTLLAAHLPRWIAS